MIEISVSTVLGIVRSIGIVDVFKRGLTWVLFSQAYRISTLYYNLRNHLGENPSDIAEHFEYDIHWELYHLGKKIGSPLFWIRAKDDLEFSRVTVCVTAENKKIRYQNCFTVYDLNSIPVQVALSSTPFRDLTFSHEGNMVYTPYDNFITKIVEIKGRSGDDIPVPYPTEDYCRPFDRLEIHMGKEQGFVEQWGEVFNLQYLEGQITRIQAELTGYSRVPLIRSIRRAALGNRLLARLVFWKRNLVRASQITRELVKFLEVERERNGRVASLLEKN
ncbi:conserved protein of unknown function [Cupriavidus taiwanensis]|uniref:Uncharacterized protein n=1 Tax=Cupriavidus taiwanensis TaxID=164546 RepID=A0A9Q7UQU2_9BURK|nr:hypothetical protein [Cupriavidus taiwanensis]SPD63014.1 conserved protein of unknown function [Cupriavidus taiwanensis]